MTILFAVRKGIQRQQQQPHHALKKLQQSVASSVGGGTQKVFYSGPAVDYDHFSHGWAVGDLGDFTGKGKYHMQTFNKISPKVRTGKANRMSQGRNCLFQILTQHHHYCVNLTKTT